MLSEPLRARDFRIISFQDSKEDGLDTQVNEWLRKQGPDVVVFDMMSGHALAVNEGSPGWSFAMTLAYGNRPRTRGTPVDHA
jgi:hypothetical protein